MFLCKEAFRILKPAGVIRIVTPDLENIVQTYLEKLRDALAGKTLAAEEYDWIVLELFDQVVRDQRGGEMAEFLRKPDPALRGFIRRRIGREVEVYWEGDPSPPSVWGKIHRASLAYLIQHARNIAAKVLVRAVAGGSAAEAIETGLFRRSGEIHFRLFDRYSLQRMLTAAGFTDMRICRADESGIPDFNSFGLDIIAGEVRKPDSLFMEARKP
jgi:hypothetical protein